MDNKTSGHMAASQGIRGHSAGDVFPYVIVGAGMPGHMHWHIIGNGMSLGDAIYPTYIAAHSDALKLRHTESRLPS